MKWMHGCYIPTQAKDRGTLEASYTLMNWILSGGYAAAISPLRGYVSGRPDLGAQYAKANGLGSDVGTAIAEAEAKIANKLIGATYWKSDDDEAKLHIGWQDMLFVAPYNYQVNLLKAVLPSDALIGSVDKFQGQEAPIVFVSMCTSDPSESPRGLDFIFSNILLH